MNEFFQFIMGLGTALFLFWVIQLTIDAIQTSRCRKALGYIRNGIYSYYRDIYRLH